MYGAGGHSQVVTDVLADMGHSVVAYINDYPSREHRAVVNTIDGIRLVSSDQFPQLDSPVVLAVGDNRERLELASLLNVEWISAVHSTALIASTVTLGIDNVILHRSIIQANASIGSHVLVNTAASIDHDCVIGDAAHISPHATLCGHVEVGEGTHIGAGATVIPSVKIGKWCTVGAGSTVIDDIPDYSVAVGSPAKVIKSNAQ